MRFRIFACLGLMMDGVRVLGVFIILNFGGRFQWGFAFWWKGGLVKSVVDYGDGFRYVSGYI